MSGAPHQVRAALPLAHALGNPRPRGYHSCIEGAVGVASAASTPNEKRTPSTVVRFPRKARHARDALVAVYITHHPEGETCASGGSHSLTDIAAETLPDLEKPVLWWRHREARRAAQAAGGNGRPGHP